MFNYADKCVESIKLSTIIPSSSIVVKFSTCLGVFKVVGKCG